MTNNLMTSPQLSRAGLALGQDTLALSAGSIFDDLLGVVRRRKMVILVTALAMTLAVYVALLFIPEKYEASAQILVMLGRENTQVPSTASKGSVFAAGVQREEVNSDIHLLKSHEIAEQTVALIGTAAFKFDPAPPKTLFQYVKFKLHQAKSWASETLDAGLIGLGLRKELTDEQKTVDLLSTSLDVAREGESNVIRVAIRLPSAELSKQVVSTVLQLYTERYAALRGSALVVPVLAKQVAADEAEVQGLLTDRKQIMREWGLSSVERQRTELVQRQQKLAYEADSRIGELDAAQAKATALAARIELLPVTERDRETTEPNPALQTLRDRLLELRSKRANTDMRYSPAMPAMRQLSDEIASVEAQLAREDRRRTGTVTTQTNPIRVALQAQVQQTDVDIAGLKATIAAQRGQLSALGDDLNRLNDGEAQLRIADLRLDSAQKRLTADTSQRDAAQLEAMLDTRQIVNVAVLSPAAATSSPIFPQKMRFMGYGLIGGLVVGVLVGMLLEWGDDRIYGVKDLARATALPSLGEFRLQAPAVRMVRVNAAPYRLDRDEAFNGNRYSS